MATLKDKRISININGETIEGVIVNALPLLTEVAITAPEWCSGVMGYKFIKSKSFQEQIKLAEDMLGNLYESCLTIQQHTEEVKMFETEYNNQYQRLTPIEQNSLIYSYVGEWLGGEIEIYTLTRVINHICGTNLTERNKATKHNKPK